MTNEEILQKAIEKAVKNGYQYETVEKERTTVFLTGDYERPDINTIIFSHDFAKAFWPNSNGVTGPLPDVGNELRSHSEASR